MLDWNVSYIRSNGQGSSLQEDVAQAETSWQEKLKEEYSEDVKIRMKNISGKKPWKDSGQKQASYILGLKQRPGVSGVWETREGGCELKKGIWAQIILGSKDW